MADTGTSVTKMKQKKKKIKAFHQKKKLFRAQDPKISVLMWGICHSINELGRVPPNVMLLKEDFKAFGKVIIKNHNYGNDNMPSHFKFKEYCPLVFQNLRERFGIDDQLYARSFQEALQMSESSGNSGAKLFETGDKAFIVKSIESEEVEMMHSLLPKYHEYVVESHGETLLPQYLGMYRVTVDGKEHYFITFRTVFSLTKTIHKKYDLKGSRVSREASGAEKSKDLPTFKDVDFTRDNVKLYVGNEKKADLLQKIRNDVEFLAAQNLMDYSLLVGIHEEDRNESDDDLDADVTNGRSDDSAEESPSSPSGERPLMGRSNSVTSGEVPMDGERYAVNSSRDSKHEIYYLGIIDVLTYYGSNKKAAHAAKTVKHGAGAEISTVNPAYYATRFMDFLEEILL
ncbi:phosphatidylinositol 5-phosphate 4-kinase type-2 beta-like isoform X2 [Rhopilema esculentum]|uniref:phosphatidylinositol 5-phosphate 4-kinase type-2 beta-like isoform X2 n=1 Tax=Rhopilema esculentum TaxID=499914 RepID=UPI0031D80095